MRFLIFALIAGLVQAAEPPGPDGLSGPELAQFLQRLQNAAQQDNPQELAKLVQFPLRVNQGSQKHKMISKRQFMASWQTIITPEIKTALLAQTPDTLFRNSRGAMVGQGELWFSAICADKTCLKHQVLLSTVNHPGNN
ncbi:MAG: hypothetical protein ACRCU9_09260 [Iodobacter sp.]